MPTSKIDLCSDLKALMEELKNEEKLALEYKNTLYANGLAQARISLENVLIAHGVQRPSTIDSVAENVSATATTRSSIAAPQHYLAL